MLRQTFGQSDAKGEDANGKRESEIYLICLVRQTPGPEFRLWCPESGGVNYYLTLRNNHKNKKVVVYGQAPKRKALKSYVIPMHYCLLSLAEHLHCIPNSTCHFNNFSHLSRIMDSQDVHNSTGSTPAADSRISKAPLFWYSPLYGLTHKSLSTSTY